MLMYLYPLITLTLIRRLETVKGLQDKKKRSCGEWCLALGRLV